MIKFECVHADTCLPDYWLGAGQLPHVQIAINGPMTLKQIKEAIREELKQGYVMGNTIFAKLLRADYLSTASSEKLTDKLTKAAYAAVNRLKPGVKGTRKFFKDIETNSESCDTVYAYFVFVEI